MKKLLLVIFILLLPSVASAATIGKVNANNIGLVGYWTFDGANMTPNVRDISGSGNSGFLVGFTSTTTMAGKVGQALKFNGNEQAINIADSSSIQTINTSKNFTASMWIYRKGDNSASAGNPIDTLLYKGPWGGNNDVATAFGIYSSYQTSPPGLQIGTTRYIGNTTLQNNKWYHVVATIDGTSDKYTLYLNGVVDKSGTTVSDLSLDSNPILVADIQDRSYDFNGIIDDVHIYNRALSATEVKALYNSGSAKVAVSSVGTTTAPLSNGLVGYWTLDGSKTNWATGSTSDSSGQGNTAQLVGMSTTTSSVVGKIGSGLNFNAINQYLKVNSISSSLDLSTTTISFWVKLASVTGAQTPLGVSTLNGSNGWQVQFNNCVSNICFQRNVSGNEKAYAGGTFVVGVWTHIVLVANGQNVSIYQDGRSLPVTNLWTGPINTGYAGTPLYIGSRQDAPNQMVNGVMDDVRIYNRALSANEVSELYNSGSAKIGRSGAASGTTTAPLSSGLVGYWTFDGSKTNWATGKTFDSSGNSNTGQLVSMSTSTSPAVGKRGQAFRFGDVVGSRISYGGVVVPTTSTVNVWIYQTAYPAAAGYGDIFTNNAGDGVWTRSNGSVDFYYSGSHTTNTLLSNNKWHMVSVVESAGNVTFYIDGALDANTYTGATQYTANSTGNDPNSGFPFFGLIDDLKVYNRALSPSEVKALYNSR